MTESYFKRDVAERVAEILAAVPGAHVETWQDYGFRLTIWVGGDRLTVMQPFRPQLGQEHINLSAAEAIAWLQARDRAE